MTGSFIFIYSQNVLKQHDGSHLDDKKQLQKNILNLRNLVKLKPGLDNMYIYMYRSTM